MKLKSIKLCLLLSLCAAGFCASAAPSSEAASLSLLLNQLRLLESTLHRAENQASVTPPNRFFFDYPQAYADIRAIRTGVEQYLTPVRAQPQPVLPLTGQYRQESAGE